jgi:hypothetical protein
MSLLLTHMMVSIYDIKSKLITFLDAAIMLIFNSPHNEHE